MPPLALQAESILLDHKAGAAWLTKGQPGIHQPSCAVALTDESCHAGADRHHNGIRCGQSSPVQDGARATWRLRILSGAVPDVWVCARHKRPVKGLLAPAVHEPYVLCYHGCESASGDTGAVQYWLSKGSKGSVVAQVCCSVLHRALCAV